MKPTLLTIGQVPISSFGLFLLLALAVATFVIWRITKVYDHDEEKVIDLVLFTFVGGLIGARVYFVLLHLDQFDNLLKMILINRYAGLSFWGGLIGGILTLKILTRYFKVNFWQAADFASLGLFIGLAFSSIGCLLGSCLSGRLSSLPIAVSQVGLLGKRFPLQIVEGLIFLILFWWLWKKTLRFHSDGQIAAQALLLLGIVKLSLEFFRGEVQLLWGNLPAGALFSSLLVLLGIILYYQQSKKSARQDLQLLVKLLTDHQARLKTWDKLAKNWYNFKVDLKINLVRYLKNLGKLIHVKSNPSKFS